MASQIQDDARRTNIIFPELASGYFQYLYSSDYAVAAVSRVSVKQMTSLTDSV